MEGFPTKDSFLSSQIWDVWTRARLKSADIKTMEYTQYFDFQSEGRVFLLYGNVRGMIHTFGAARVQESSACAWVSTVQISRTWDWCRRSCSHWVFNSWGLNDNKGAESPIFGRGLKTHWKWTLFHGICGHFQWWDTNGAWFLWFWVRQIHVLSHLFLKLCSYSRKIMASSGVSVVLQAQNVEEDAKLFGPTDSATGTSNIPPKNFCLVPSRHMQTMKLFHWNEASINICRDWTLWINHKVKLSICQRKLGSNLPS